MLKVVRPCCVIPRYQCHGSVNLFIFHVALSFNQSMMKFKMKLGMYKHDDNDQLDNAAYKNSR